MWSFRAKTRENSYSVLFPTQTYPSCPMLRGPICWHSCGLSQEKKNTFHQSVFDSNPILDDWPCLTSSFSIIQNLFLMTIWRFPFRHRGYPQFSSIFIGSSHYKPSIFGVPPFSGNTPYSHPISTSTNPQITHSSRVPGPSLCRRHGTLQFLEPFVATGPQTWGPQDSVQLPQRSGWILWFMVDITK